MKLSCPSWGGCGYLLSVGAKQRVQRCFVGCYKHFHHPQENLMLKLLLMWVGLGFEVTYLIKRFVWVFVFFFYYNCSYKGCGGGCPHFPLWQCAAQLTEETPHCASRRPRGMIVSECPWCCCRITHWGDHRQSNCVSSKCTWLMDLTAKLPKPVYNRAVSGWVLCYHEMAFHRARQGFMNRWPSQTKWSQPAGIIKMWEKWNARHSCTISSKTVLQARDGKVRI